MTARNECRALRLPAGTRAVASFNPSQVILAVD
jgi:hypothetical protein